MIIVAMIDAMMASIVKLMRMVVITVNAIDEGMSREYTNHT